MLGECGENLPYGKMPSSEKTPDMRLPPSARLKNKIIGTASLQLSIDMYIIWLLSERETIGYVMAVLIPTDMDLEITVRGCFNRFVIPSINSLE